MSTRTAHPAIPKSAIDWSGCDLVEVVPGKVSGVPILKNSRLQADSVVENFESGSSAQEIADMFRVPLDTVRGVLAYAKAQQERSQQ